MSTRDQAQLGLDEKVVDDAALLAALDERQAAKDALGEARKTYTKLHDEVRSRIDRLDLGVDTAVRVGRYRIAKTETTARSVAFDVDAKERISIGLIGEDE